MRTRTIPPGARHLRTYTELESYLANFIQGLYPFLLILGRPGVAKTESLNTAVRGRSVYLCKGGQVTPVQLYIECFHHRGQPIILDDAEHLLGNTIGAKLISALGDSSPARLMSYATTGRILGDVPQRYYTTSALCIIANRITALEEILSRAVILYFDPTNLEIHRAVARWYWDQEIHDWFGQHLYRLPPLDTRWYVIADRDKRAGRDWQQLILKTHAPDRASCVIQALEDNPAHPTREDKARRFVELLGTAKQASRASYFRLRRRLEEEQRLVPEANPPIPLRFTKPPGVPSLVELGSMEAPLPVQPAEDTRPLDLPAHEQFAQPIRGQGTPPSAPTRQVLDDRLPGERPTKLEDEEGDK